MIKLNFQEVEKIEGGITLACGVAIGGMALTVMSGIAVTGGLALGFYLGGVAFSGAGLLTSCR